MKKNLNKKMLIMGIILLTVALATAVAVTTYAVWTQQTEDSTDIRLPQGDLNPSAKYIIFRALDAEGNFTDGEAVSYAAVGYTGLVAELVIPEEHEGKAVTRVTVDGTQSAYSYFAGNQVVTSISIPASVTRIDDGTFANMTYLRKLILVDSAVELEIGMGAFAGCIALNELSGTRSWSGTNSFIGTPLG